MPNRFTFGPTHTHTHTNTHHIVGVVFLRAHRGENGFHGQQNGSTATIGVVMIRPKIYNAHTHTNVVPLRTYTHNNPLADFSIFAFIRRSRSCCVCVYSCSTLFWCSVLQRRGSIRAMCWQTLANVGKRWNVGGGRSILGSATPAEGCENDMRLSTRTNTQTHKLAARLWTKCAAMRRGRRSGR